MRFDTRRRARREVIDWLVWCSSRSLHSMLGYMSPMKYGNASSLVNENSPTMSPTVLGADGRSRLKVGGPG